jgi:hypothetical protein
VSRQFDTSGGADSITFSPGNAPPDQGPITLAVLAKSFSVAGFTMWMARGTKTGTAIWGMLTSNNSGPKIFAENDFGNGVAGLSTSWRWYVMTKASGSALPRIHVWDLSGAWSHTDNSANVADGSGPIDTIIVGSAGGGANGWRGSIAVEAACDTAMNDAAVEAAFTLSAADTLTAMNAATKRWMVRLNQASAATSVTDDTSGSGDQSAISGTSVDADDPPGYSYSLTPAQSVAPTGIAVTAATGTPTIAQSLTVAPTGIGVTAATGTPTIAQSLTVAPTGIGITATPGTPTVAMTSLACAPNGIAVSITLGTPTLSQGGQQAPAGNNWGSLLSIYRQNAADVQRFLTTPLTQCPYHAYPLEPGRTPNTTHCKFGGEIFDLYGNRVLIS